MTPGNQNNHVRSFTGEFLNFISENYLLKLAPDWDVCCQKEHEIAVVSDANK